MAVENLGARHVFHPDFCTAIFFLTLVFRSSLDRLLLGKKRGCTYRTTFCTVKVAETAKTASEKLSLPTTDHRIAGDVNVL